MSFDAFAQWNSRPLVAWTFSVAVLLSVGCSRTFYRHQADREVYQAIAEKSNDPRWAIPGFSVLPDPRSRIFDPNNPDCQPMPEDDPYSHQLMQCLDGKKGYRRWLKNGIDYHLENEVWRDHLSEFAEVTPEGAYRLGLNDAVRIALINSRDYQDQLETLYLSALDVTTERFAFDSQYFLGTGPTFRHRGYLNPGGERNTLTVGTDGQLRRTFATGGNLVVGFANQFLWEFSGPNTNNTNTLLTFALAQPLLRGSGRALNLERLTRTERTLLANVRQFERYRHGFYTGIAVGDEIRGLTRAGGFFGGTGLTGFTGTGAGGIGGVGSGQFGFDLGGAGGGGGGAAGVAGLAGGGEGNVGGYIGMLQLLQQIRNSRASLNAKLRNLEVLQANYEAGLINLTQVDTFRQSIETERAQLLQQENNLQTQMDNFKVQRLSLPPDLAIELDDTMIRRFQLIDPKVTEIDERLSNFVSDFGDYEQTPSADELSRTIQELARFAAEIRPLFTTTAGDLARLEANSAARTRGMSPSEVERFQQDKQRMQQTLADLTANFDRHEEQVHRLMSDVATQPPTTVADGIVTVCVDLISIVQELSLIQVRARLDSITLDPLNLTPAQALEIARAHRLDWMNNRAALVDTWRLIEYNANALLSDLDVIIDGDIGTVGNNPVKFRAPTGGLRAGLRFDTPLTRLIERNNYRQALISYQQARRSQVEFEDGIYQAMRARLRSLEQFRLNLEIQRLAVVIAARRVDQTRETLNAPPPPAEPGAAPSQLGPTAAEDLLSALTALRDAQNNFMSVWLNYYAGRMLLYRDMGIIKLDAQNIWIDEPFRLEDWLPGDGCGCNLPPAVPQAWIDALGGTEPDGSSMGQNGAPAEPVDTPPPEGAPRGTMPPSSPSPLFGPGRGTVPQYPSLAPPHMDGAAQNRGAAPLSSPWQPEDVRATMPLGGGPVRENEDQAWVNYPNAR